MTDGEYFDYKYSSDFCPYTDKLCTNAWDCANCSVETREQLWAEEPYVDCESCSHCDFDFNYDDLDGLTYSIKCDLNMATHQGKCDFFEEELDSE